MSYSITQWSQKRIRKKQELYFHFKKDNIELNIRDVCESLMFHKNKHVFVIKMSILPMKQIEWVCEKYPKK